MAESAKIGHASEPGEYDEGMLALLQLIWGDGFLSPGGADELARLFEGIDIRGSEVLDIGCGLGAIDELLITQYGASSVVGIDVEPAPFAGLVARVEHAGLAGGICGVNVKTGGWP
jgi:phosphoethanolamine N-methyltransferase